MKKLDNTSEKGINGSEKVRTGITPSIHSPKDRPSSFRAFTPVETAISGTDLFSFFTADIIKKETLFTR